MSLESVLARVAELQTAIVARPAPPSAAPSTASGTPAAGAGGTFADALRGALGPQAAAGPAGASAGVAAAPGPSAYPNLSGDVDANPEILARLDRLAAARGERVTVTSGLRTDAEQARLWAARAGNPFPVARPGTSVHRTGAATDVTIGGRPIQDVVPAAQLRAAGLEPLAGDAVHVQLPAAGS